MKKVKLNYSFVIGYIAFNKTAESETAFFILQNEKRETKYKHGRLKRESF